MSLVRFIPRRRIRLLASTFALAVLAAMGVFALASGTGVGEELELRTLDWRFADRGERPVSKDIVILGIDNKTDEDLGLRFPYPRSRHAAVVDALTAAGARTIVFDVQFLEATDPVDDDAFVNAMARSGRVVLATSTEGNLDTQRGKRSRTTPLPLRGLPGALDASRADIGLTDQLRSADDVVRWVRPMTRTDVAGTSTTLPALPLAVLAHSENKRPFEYQLPERFAINFRGGPSVLRENGYEIRNYSLAVSPDTDLAWARDRIVLVGATSAVLQDLHETPFGGSDRMPGVEIHAHALDTIRNKDWLREQSPRDAALATAALVVLCWLLLVLTPLWLGAVLALGANIAYALLAARAFAQDSVWSLVPAIGAGTACFLVTVLALAITAVRDRRHVTNLFSRYVSPEVVRELVDIHEDIRLGGERREVSILFSDIRGFTTMSEGLDPADLVGQLNDYFEEMVDAVEFERGTFDKFIGDGLMAIFGAPLHQPDHADRACAAALQMVDRLETLNAERHEAGLKELEIGIGVHTGEAIVGNIGSPRRRVDYTAIGDTVNLASRLESNTKTVGVRILVSKETAEAASDHVFVPRGEIVVKGRTRTTEVFELTADAGRRLGTDGDAEAGARPSANADADGQAA